MNVSSRWTSPINDNAQEHNNSDHLITFFASSLNPWMIKVSLKLIFTKTSSVHGTVSYL